MTGPVTLQGAVSLLTSPPAVLGVLAAGLWAPATGLATWPVLVRGRPGLSVSVSIAVGLFVFLLARRLAAGAWR